MNVKIANTFKKLLDQKQINKEKKSLFNFSTNFAIYNSPINTTNISLHYPSYQNYGKIQLQKNRERNINLSEIVPDKKRNFKK